MRRGVTIAMFMEVALLIWVMAAAPVFAESAATGGARSVAGATAVGSIQAQKAEASSTVVQEITTAFTAAPTTGSLGDALEASRTTFSTAEVIEFDAVLLESGLAGTTAQLVLYHFDAGGRSFGPIFVVNGVVAPSDRTGFFIQLPAGSIAAGQWKWLMLVNDAFGNAFVTPFQPLVVQ